MALRVGEAVRKVFDNIHRIDPERILGEDKQQKRRNKDEKRRARPVYRLGPN